jgi:hypothetical protein
MRSQKELHDVWDAIENKKYGQDPSVRKPEKIIDDAVEQVMGVPTEDGLGLDHYSRKPGGDWSITPFVGNRSN